MAEKYLLEDASMKKTFLVVVLLITCLGIRQGYSYSYDCWGAMTGAKTLSVNPLFYGSSFDPFDLTADLVVTYGISDKFDLFVNLATLAVVPSFGYSGSWLMPRVALNENNILALQIGVANGTPLVFNLFPQYHFFWENERIALELNAGYNFTFDAPDAGNVIVYAAPVYKIIPKRVALFCELDPAYSVGTGTFTFTLMPGLCFGLGSEGEHQICVGISVSGIESGTVSAGYGIWYWKAFTL
jgi:hypothetical protein